MASRSARPVHVLLRVQKLPSAGLLRQLQERFHGFRALRILQQSDWSSRPKRERMEGTSRDVQIRIHDRMGPNAYLRRLSRLVW